MRINSPLRLVLVVIAVLLVVGGIAYAFLLPGLSKARQEPSGLETEIATWLLDNSVPAAAARATNPLGPKVAESDITAGRTLFRQKCEVCHAYDGGGKTEIG